MEKKITWTIKNFSSNQSERIYSDSFVVGGCKWLIMVCPKGFRWNPDDFSVFLDVADSNSLPSGWKRHVKSRVTIVNQLSHELSKVKESQVWFDQIMNVCSFENMIPHTKLYDKDGGFLVNNEVKIVAEIEVLEVVGKLDAFGESSYVVQTIEVNGFQALPSQVESVRKIFERHPDIAVKVRAKKQHLRNACMSFLLNLIETLCLSLTELSMEDLEEADNMLKYLKDAGLQVDWLEKKLEEVKEKKEKEQLRLARRPEMKNGLLKLKQECSAMEDLVEKEEAELSASRFPLSFDDVV